MTLSSTSQDSISTSSQIQEVFNRAVGFAFKQRSIPKAIQANIDLLNNRIKEVHNELQLLINSSFSFGPSKIQEHEENIHRITRLLSDLILARDTQVSLASEEVRETGKQVIKSGKSCINKGIKSVSITFAGGNTIVLNTTYYSRKGAAGKKGKGYYPDLLVLEIYCFSSPVLVSRIATAAVTLGSYAEAVEILKSQGIKTSGKFIMRLLRRLCENARYAQENGVVNLTVPEGGVKDKKVVISIDGGRIRTRRQKRGPKTSKKRNRYHTDWREPKLIIIYVVDENGRMSKNFLPIIDGIISGADAIFELLFLYLSKMNLQDAEEILFVADGATWIWERVAPLEKRLNEIGVECEIHQLIDFYHAAQHLYDFVKCKSKWSTKERKRWVNKQKKQLKEGKIDEVIVAMKSAMKGQRQKVMKKEYRYFVKNRARMNYKTISDLGLPIGSGAIESAIRRIVNLRLKSPCVFWKEDGANAVLMLRSYFKAGRWKDLTQTTYSGEVMMLSA